MQCYLIVYNIRAKPQKLLQKSYIDSTSIFRNLNYREWIMYILFINQSTHFYKFLSHANNERHVFKGMRLFFKPKLFVIMTVKWLKIKLCMFTISNLSVKMRKIYQFRPSIEKYRNRCTEVNANSLILPVSLILAKKTRNFNYSKRKDLKNMTNFTKLLRIK